MIPDTVPVWGVILGLGLGTYLIRLSFLGLIGHKAMPDWVLRHLRYTAVAVLPALVAPLVLWPQATDGQPDAVRLAAAAATLGVGMLTRSAIWAIAAGATVLGLGLALGL